MPLYVNVKRGSIEGRGPVFCSFYVPGVKLSKRQVYIASRVYDGKLSEVDRGYWHTNPPLLLLASLVSAGLAILCGLLAANVPTSVGATFLVIVSVVLALLAGRYVKYRYDLWCENHWNRVILSWYDDPAVDTLIYTLKLRVSRNEPLLKHLSFVETRDWLSQRLRQSGADSVICDGYSQYCCVTV